MVNLEKSSNVCFYYNTHITNNAWFKIKNWNCTPNNYSRDHNSFDNYATWSV